MTHPRAYNNIDVDDLRPFANQKDTIIFEYLYPDTPLKGGDYRQGDKFGEKGSSFVYSPADHVWFDHQSLESGGIIDLWMAVKGVSLNEACNQVAEFINYAKPKRTAHEYLKHRKINQETINAFQIKEDENILTIPRIDEAGECKGMIKKVLNDDNAPKYINEGKANVTLVGKNLIKPDCKVLAICEGVIDCMSLHQAGIPSVTISGISHAWIDKEREFLSRFDKFLIILDNDDAGQAAAVKYMDLLGAEKCRNILLPYKDPNDCLVKGINLKEFIFSVPPKVFEITKLEQKVLDIYYPPEGTNLGYKTPWPECPVLFRPGELSIWTGTSGHGKTQMLGNCLLAMIEQGAKVCIASLESSPQRILSDMIRQYTDQETPTRGEVKTALNELSNSLYICDRYNRVELDDLLKDFYHMYSSHDVDVFTIDPLLLLGVGHDDYDGQSKLISKLNEFKDKTKAQVHLVAHPRKGVDENGHPGKMDIKGTGDIVNLVDNIYVVWKNVKRIELEALYPADQLEAAKLYAKDKKSARPDLVLDSQEIRYLNLPYSSFSCTKDRHGDAAHTAFQKLNFDKRSKQFTPVENGDKVTDLQIKNIEPSEEVIKSRSCYEEFLEL